VTSGECLRPIETDSDRWRLLDTSDSDCLRPVDTDSDQWRLSETQSCQGSSMEMSEISH
jgi:hypothetical protein